MQNFTLITNEFKDKDLCLTHRIISYIESKGGKAGYLLNDYRPKTNMENGRYEIPEGTEGILVLGGDGTLIRAATAVEASKIPLIGVNLGTLGYLCELEETNVFQAIDSLMADQYTVENRMMLTGRMNHSSKSSVALNDIVIHSTGELTILSILVYVNGELLGTYHGDGMIIATPTGSTGYNMSAGGPIVDPKASVILLTPINAHNLSSKSIVLGADDVIELEIGPRRYEADETASVSFDGDKKESLHVGERLIISKASNITGILKLNNRSFLESLRKKMANYT